MENSLLPMFAVMAGIYIHIPFCRKACYYCNFHFSTSFQTKDELLEAMVKEIRMQVNYLSKKPVETIYFGGGTPSALPYDDLENILQEIRKNFEVLDSAEVTLEANPDDITSENLQHWKGVGINRLSIGIQAFQDNLLKNWNRSHNAAQALDAISLSQKAGFYNITADLIYGGPGLTDEDWLSNIQRLVDSGIPHISSYALTVEPNTALAHQIKKGIAAEPDDEQAGHQYGMLQNKLKEAGFLQYEVSNFAKAGMASRHNTSYWSGAHYLGIGPSAHSFNGHSRQWNVDNNIKYIKALDQDDIPFEKEELTKTQQYNELVMTGLRTSRGIDADLVEKLGHPFLEYLFTHIQEYINQGKVAKNENGHWVLNPEQYFFADGIAAYLFYVEEG
jgi:oxygen-independent coproporphyrinogen-3 oxidase